MQKCQTIELSDYQTVELAIAEHPMFHTFAYMFKISNKTASSMHGVNQIWGYLGQGKEYM